MAASDGFAMPSTSRSWPSQSSPRSEYRCEPAVSAVSLAGLAPIPRIRLAGPPLHPGRAASRPPALIHARRGRDPLQSGHEAHLGTRRQARSGHHAQTPGPGQRPDPTRVDPPYKTTHRGEFLADALTGTSPPESNRRNTQETNHTPVPIGPSISLALLTTWIPREGRMPSYR